MTPVSQHHVGFYTRFQCATLLGVCSAAHPKHFAVKCDLTLYTFTKIKTGFWVLQSTPSLANNFISQPHIGQRLSIN